MFLFVPVFTYLYAVILLRRRRKFKKTFQKRHFHRKKLLFFSSLDKHSGMSVLTIVERLWFCVQTPTKFYLNLPLSTLSEIDVLVCAATTPNRAWLKPGATKPLILLEAVPGRNSLWFIQHTRSQKKKKTTSAKYFLYNFHRDIIIPRLQTWKRTNRG